MTESSAHESEPIPRNSEERSAGEWTLSDKLKHLFANYNPPGKRPPSIEAVVEAIAEKGETRISVGYLSELRSGQATNPRIDHLRALADFFGVDVAYFVDDSRTEEINAQLRLIAAMRDAKVRNLALRAGELDAASLDAITLIVAKQAGDRGDS